MADKKFTVNLNLLNNEIQNVKFQSLASNPQAPSEGQFWYNSSTKTPYFYDGTQVLPFSGDSSIPIATTVTLGGVIVGANISVDSNGKINVADASTTTKGVIEIATDAEATAGTSTGVAITPKHLGDTKSALQTQITTINNTLATYGNIVTHNTSEFATSAQGALADTALQPNDNISELTNDAEYITLEDLSATNNISYNNTTGVIGVTTGYQIPTDTQVGKIDTALQPANILDVVTSTSTTDALSANQGKELADRITNLEALGRYLSDWNCATGLAITNPPVSPYAYKTGDYFLVSNVATSGTNYRPAGASYVTGQASTTEETQDVKAGDMYLYDGTQWILRSIAQRDVSFANIAGQPTDNLNLASALNAKVTANSAITGGTHTKITYDSKGLVTAGTDLTKSDIPALDYLSDDTTIDDLLPTQTGNEGKALITNGTNAYWGFATQKITINNPALTQSGGVVTWTISNTIGSADVVCSLREVSTGEEVYAEITYGASSIVIKMNSTTNISAGTYRAIIIG